MGVLELHLKQLSPRGEEVSSILEYITKDKEKVCNENEGNKKRSYTSRRHSPLMSNPNFPDSIPDANTTDEDSDDMVGELSSSRIDLGKST
ncbi:hypothetical protein Bca4012_000688 [Brassica carinata]